MSNSDNIPPADRPPEIPDETTNAGEIVEADSPPAETVKRRSVAKSAGIVSAFVMLSRIFGLIREQIFAGFFGVGPARDAFIVAFRIPNLLRDLFAEGALSVAFVKVFTDFQTNVSEKEAWRLAALIFNALAVVLSGIVVLGMILAPLIVAFIGKDFFCRKS